MLKINSFSKILNYFLVGIKKNTQVLFWLICFKAITTVIIGVSLYFIIPKKYLVVCIGIIYIVNFISKIIDGGFEYRNTFIFPFEQLKDLSIANEKKIYKTQLYASLIYSFINDELFCISVFYLVLLVSLSNMSILLVSNFVMFMVCGFVLGNLIVGKYMYSVIINRITILRMVIYFIFGGGCLFFIAYGGETLVSFVSENFINKINSWELLLDNAYIEKVFEGFGATIITSLRKFEQKIVSLTLVFISLGFGIICIVALIVMLKVRIELIPIQKHDKIYKGKDLYYIYYKFIKKLGQKENLFVKNQIEKLWSYRWLLAKPFFQLTIMDYESIIYMVLLIFMAYRADESVMELQLIICMNILVIVNQCSELRRRAYVYFSLSTENDYLKLVKMSLADCDIIWKAKERVYKYFLVIPTLIVLLVDIVVCINKELPFYYFIIISLIWIGSILIMPIVQLYMIPGVSNMEYLSETQIGEDFFEDEVAGKMQEFPRIFLVVVPMLLTIFMIAVKSFRMEIIVFVEFIYLLIVMLIFYKYLNKIRDKGVEHIFEKIG